MASTTVFSVILYRSACHLFDRLLTIEILWGRRMFTLNRSILTTFHRRIHISVKLHPSLCEIILMSTTCSVWYTLCVWYTHCVVHTWSSGSTKHRSCQTCCSPSLWRLSFVLIGLERCFQNILLNKLGVSFFLETFMFKVHFRHRGTIL